MPRPDFETSVPWLTTQTFALLNQQRALASYPGRLLDKVRDRWGALQLSVLTELSVAGEVQGYLVFQTGQLVYAERGHSLNQAALSEIVALLPSITLRAFSLDAASAALALAAIDGEQRPTQNMTPQRLDEQLSNLTASRFSGALATTLESGLGIWHFRQGSIVAAQRLPDLKPPPAALLLAWEERSLAALALPAPPRPANPVSGQRPDRYTDDDTVWRLFFQVAQAHLGHPAERLLHLMQAEHGSKRADQLRRALTGQVDRFAGPMAAQQFAERLMTDAFSPSSVVWTDDV